MPLIKNDALPTGNLKGGDYGASISLILDKSEPGQGPRLHDTPTTKPGSSSKEPSPSTPTTTGSPPDPATS
jgi:hypothetical protein